MSQQEHNIFFKIVLIGDSGVGKTNILSRYINNKFDVNSSVTIGVEYFNKILKIKGEEIKIAIWDTCGQEKYKAVTSIYYKGVVGACLIFDLGNRSTFLGINKWLDELNQQASGVVKLLMGNKCDLINRQVTSEQALQFAQKHDLHYMETSAAKAINVRQAFEKLVTQIYKEWQNTSRIIPKQKNSILLNEVELKDKKPKQTCHICN